jgi:sugar phosphate permease
MCAFAKLVNFGLEEIMGTIFVAALVAVIVGLIIYSMVRDKKNGKSIQCGGDCKHCGGHCH